MSEEATINPDGSQTFEGTVPPVDDPVADEPPLMDEETIEELAKGIDPALILGALVLLFAVLYYFFVVRNKKQDQDEFFSDLDGDKVRWGACERCTTLLAFNGCLRRGPTAFHNLTHFLCFFFSSTSNCLKLWRNTMSLKPR
jgi:hypothetical protein